ncbi:hypothetical protein GOODEAATRI_017832, partial [Goodea atripinnis]
MTNFGFLDEKIVILENAVEPLDDALCPFRCSSLGIECPQEQALWDWMFTFSFDVPRSSFTS